MMEVVTLGTSGYATRSHLSLFRKDITRAPYDVTTALCSLTQHCSVLFIKDESG